MANDLAKRQPTFGDSNYDDGFSESASSAYPMRSTSFLRWTEQLHWIDRDRMTPPSPLLVYGIDESVRRWRTIDGKKQPQDIWTKPLPDRDELNRTTPQSEWERQLDGSVGAGWKREVFVYLVNLGTGDRYTYSNNTYGAYKAWDLLREAVITVRALRGTKCYPLVNLTERPMPSKFRPTGMGMRPHFEVIDWKIPGGDTTTIAPNPTPQISGPVSAPNPTTQTAAAPAAQPRQPKPPITLGDYTRAVMGDVKPVTTAEILNDSLDDLPWDNKQ
jgi:hypothetical protein